MTLRTNEIGADVYSRTETELDKNNLSTPQNETEKRRAFPELAPGRALVNAATGELIEFHHQMHGFVDTVEGRLSEREEYLNKEYGTPKGQNWGGVIEHFFVSITRKDCPMPNEHGEVPVPLNRPDESEIIDVKPETFEREILFSDSGRANPLLLVERPQAAYSEITGGETFTVKGWYDPSAEKGDRVNPVSDMGEQHPEITGVDYNVKTKKQLRNKDVRITADWDVQVDTAAIRVESDSDGFTVESNTNRSDVHIEVGQTKNDGKQVLIDAPYSMKEKLDALTCGATWNNMHRMYQAPPTTSVVFEVLNSFTSDGCAVSMDAAVMDDLGETIVDVITDEETHVTVNDVFEYTFTIEDEIGVKTSIPGIAPSVDLDGVDAESNVVISPSDSVEVSVSSSEARNHIVSINEDTFVFDCPRESSSIVKSLPWKEARYDFNKQAETWDINRGFVGDIIRLCIEAEEPVSVSTDVVDAVGSEESIVETTEISVDSDEIVGMDSYVSGDGGADVVDMDVETSVSAHDVFGVVNPSSELSLLNLELTTTDDEYSESVSIDLGSSELHEVPDYIVDEWNVTSDSDEMGTYEWVNPQNTARIRVVETDGWGCEFDVYVETPHGNDFENVCTVADEKKTTLEVIKFLKTLASNE